MSGVGRVVAFNWPRYAIGLVVVAVALAVPAPDPLRYPVRFGAWLAAGWIVASLVVTWWVYDRTALYDWAWVTGLLAGPPGHYAVVSAGLDEISPTLRRLFPSSEATLLDLYDPRLTREGSIRRARALVPPPAEARAARPDLLPLPDASIDAVFLVFAAHELRAAGQRQALFAEIARTLRPGGRLLLVEHCRDAANIAAYGPGAWHFYPRTQWLRLARGAGLTPTADQTMTPLVHALAFHR
jgi:SAM-dependent methyltransferase